MSEQRQQQVADRMSPFGRRRGGPGMGIAAEVQSAENIPAVLRRIVGYLGRYRWKLVAVTALVVLSSGLSLLTPYLTGLAIDEGIIPGDVGRLLRIVLLMTGAYVVADVGVWGQSVLMIHVAQGSLRDLRRDLFDRLQVLSLRFFDRYPHGELMSRLTNDTETIGATLGDTVTRLIGSALSVTGSLVAMFLLSWQLALVVLVTLPLTFAITRFVANGARIHYRDRQRDLGRLNGIIEETVSGQQVVKVCRREGTAIAEFDDANIALRASGTAAGIFGGLMGPSMGLVRNMTFALLAGIGGWMVLRDWTTIGIVAAFINYARNFSRPLNEIAMLYASLQSAIAGAERVFAIMDEVPEITDAPDATPLTEVRGHVVFDGVNFGYDPAEPVLRDVSFDARPGQTIALVGPTGAGKTTIINLLTRFYDIDSGRISVDGHDIRDVRADDLRNALGIVLQDTFLFAGTVRENIRYGRLDATDEEVEEAARLANAHTFITRLPHGYDTPLSEAGGTLSEGQRQLLAIARAILADPAILILDEATSSVDSRTEAHIQEAMERIMEGRTSFVIAHRLSTIRRADCILVIEHGRIVERGTHEELLEARGAYHALYTSQTGGEVAA
ncbi:MAG: ABC transporter ATP-binding protein [candidate division WS1 bacterium]|nr:ABC transporter ATP-binding protein [candidate division WS1 bacterium]